MLDSYSPSMSGLRYLTAPEPLRRDRRRDAGSRQLLQTKRANLTSANFEADSVPIHPHRKVPMRRISIGCALAVSLAGAPAVAQQTTTGGASGTAGEQAVLAVVNALFTALK